MPSGSKDKNKAKAPASQQPSTPAPKPAPAKQKQVAKQNQAQVGAVLRSQGPSQIAKPPAETVEQRQAAINNRKQTIVGELTTDVIKKIDDKVAAQMDKLLAAEKKKILEDVRAAVKLEIQQQEAGGTHAGMDADSLVQDSAAWKEAATAAGEEKKKLFGDAQKDAIKNAADPAFVVKQADLSLDVEKHAKQVKSTAKGLIETKAKEIANTVTQAAINPATKTDLVAMAKGKATTKATGAVAGEATKLTANKDNVDDAIKTPVADVKKELHASQLEYLEKGLGAQGTGWFRSKEFKNFHANMKTAAREKGHEKTEQAIVEKRGKGGAQAGHEAEFEYQSLQAHLHAHDDSKMELRGVMKTLAADLLGQAEGKTKFHDLLEVPASTAAWAALRKDAAAMPAATKAATAAVKAAKPKAEEALHKEARDLKNAYVKVQDKDPKEQAKKQQKSNDDLVADKVNPAFEKTVETDVGGGQKEQQHFGHKMLKKAMEAPTAGKGLELAAKLIDAATPQHGDQSELEVEIKIPATHGAFCFFTVTGSAQRSNRMELGLTINFGAGWETWGLSARGGFLIYFKAGAADTVTAMQLIHYGAYRNLTHASDTAANFWAGAVDPKKTSISADPKKAAEAQKKEVGKTEQSELWAAMMEERVFGPNGKDKEAYVEMGGGINGKASLKAGLEGEVSGELTTARRWDKDVFADIAADTTNTDGHGAGKMGKRTKPDNTLKSREDRKSLAMAKRELVEKHVKRVVGGKFGLSVGAEANGQKFGIGITGEGQTGPQGAFKVEATGNVPYDPSAAGSSTQFSKIAASYVPAALSGIKKIYDAYKAAHPDQAPNAENDTGGDPEARIPGAILDGGEDLLIGLDAGGLTNNLLKSLSEANPQNLAGSQAEGVNDTARLWLGNDLHLKDGMGAGSDMSKTVSDAPTAQPFGAKSQLSVALSVEWPNKDPKKPDKNVHPKVTFKVISAKEMKMGGDLGAGVGLSARLTRKQELAGVSTQLKDKAPQPGAPPGAKPETEREWTPFFGGRNA